MERTIGLNHEKTLRTMEGSTAAEAVVGIGAVVLTILALSDVYPEMFTAIAGIAVGAAFLIQGVAISANYSTLLNEIAADERQSVAFTGGITTEFIGGLGGITLGVLALIGIDPVLLLSISVIVFGGTLLLSAGETAEFSSTGYPENARSVYNKAIRSTAGAQLLIGLGAVALGIIALTVTSANALLLSTIGILAVGVVEFSKGTALAAKIARVIG